MKRSNPIRFILAALAIAAAATPALAAPRTYTMKWTSPSPAAANGTIVLDDAVCVSPGGNSLMAPVGCIVDLSITITGAVDGNGTFTLANFNDVIFNPSVPLNWDAELLAQGFSDVNFFGVAPAPLGVGPFIMRPDASGGMNDLTLAEITPTAGPEPEPEFPFAADAQQCADAIAAAGAKYFSALHKSLHGCRSGLMKGTPLFTDKAKTIPMESPSGCADEFKASGKIAKARAKVRSAIAKKCTDALLANLFACAATVDGLVDASGTMGCVISTTEANVGTVLDAEFGF
jgi:hypothetical protein